MPDRVRIHGTRLNRGPRANPYNNSSWRAIRAEQLMAYPLCVNYSVCRNAATVADHVTPLRYGGTRLQSMCAPCHNRKRATTDKLPGAFV